MATPDRRSAGLAETLSLAVDKKPERAGFVADRPRGRAALAAGPETPSGKQAKDENFPVGSILIARRLRPHVAAFYAFARAADDIADNPALEPEEKCARLDAFASALSGEALAAGFEKAKALRESCLETGVSIAHGLTLLEAFRQDAVKTRYRDLEDLIAYCRRSADPVGRFLLDLHGEDAGLYEASDALCTVLQILNHLQDMSDDYRALDRVYLPLDLMEAEGALIVDLAAERSSPGLERVRQRLLDTVVPLQAKAESLAGRLKSRRLAMETAVIAALSRRLARRLRASDPLAERVALTKADFAAAAMRGLMQGLTHGMTQGMAGGRA